MHNINNNPYSPPESNVADVQPIGDGSFIPRGRSTPFLSGPKWIDQSIKMFMQQPKVWLLITFIFFGLQFLMSYLPDLAFSSGSNMSLSLGFLPFLQILLETIIFAGVICVAESQRLTGLADFNLIGSGFTNRTGAIIGSFFIGILVAIIGFIFALILVGFAAMPYIDQLTDALDINNEAMIIDALRGIGFGKMFLAMVIALLGIVIGEMLTCFVPPLVMIHQMPLGQALSMSFSGSLKNILPTIAYIISIIIVGGLLYFVVAKIMGLDQYIGLIFTLFSVVFTYLPLYAAYRSIFTRTESLNN